MTPACAGHCDATVHSAAYSPARRVTVRRPHPPGEGSSAPPATAQGRSCLRASRRDEPVLVEVEAGRQEVRDALVEAGDEDAADSRFGSFSVGVESQRGRGNPRRWPGTPVRRPRQEHARVGPAPSSIASSRARRASPTGSWSPAGPHRPAATRVTTRPRPVPMRAPLAASTPRSCESAGSHVLVVACDLPFVTAPLLVGSWRSPTAECDAVVPRTADGVSATLRRLRAPLEREVRRRIESGRLKIPTCSRRFGSRRGPGGDRRRSTRTDGCS